MTQIRRPAKQEQRVTLMRVFLSLAAILVITVALFEIDAFPTKRHKNASNSISLDKLAQMQTLPERELIRRRSPDPDSLAVDSSGSGAASGVAVATKESSQDGNRRFAFQIEGLKDGKEGTVIIETRPNWAPIGVEHFHKLVENKFYDQCRFFRVLDDFMVQFGIAALPEKQKEWKTDILKDDPWGVQTNSRGTLTYATSGKNTRTTQLFINTRTDGNGRLDKEGFAPIGLVIEGMEFVDMIENKYREKPNQGKIVSKGNAYLKDEFIDLSYIVTIRDVTEN
jgi:peptidyl-prolyl cis-trans isomerase A (cyclophilin A)